VVASSRTVLQTIISINVEHRNLEHWFTDKPSRLQAWRAWRISLTDLSPESVHQEVATWWKFVPLVSKTFDPWRQETWPDPWALIGTGSFCPSGQGLGMFYSLVLANVKCELMLAVIADTPRLMVILPDNKLLNYYDGEVIDVADVVMQILQTWAPSDLANLVKV
jgi:hypothetical protein